MGLQHQAAQLTNFSFSSSSSPVCSLCLLLLLLLLFLFLLLLLLLFLLLFLQSSSSSSFSPSSFLPPLFPAQTFFFLVIFVFFYSLQSLPDPYLSMSTCLCCEAATLAGRSGDHRTVATITSTKSSHKDSALSRRTNKRPTRLTSPSPPSESGGGGPTGRGVKRR